jgi:hypothetical protein
VTGGLSEPGREQRVADLYSDGYLANSIGSNDADEAP